jgi:Uma2 family endonuclease
MIANPNFTALSPSEYLAAEAQSLVKHEYRQGEVYAMAGASNHHVLITVNLATLLRTHLRGSGCRIYAADTKVGIEALNIYYYPDVVVSCDERDRTLSDYLLSPALLIEVLSESTEAFDRGDKFSDYRHLNSLQEYVLVSQTQRRVETFRKNPQGQWVLYTFHDGARFYLETLGFSCAIADIYEDID